MIPSTRLAMARPRRGGDGGSTVGGAGFMLLAALGNPGHQIRDSNDKAKRPGTQDPNFNFGHSEFLRGFVIRNSGLDLAVRPGFEPGQRPPKGLVLPLHHRTDRDKTVAFKTPTAKQNFGLLARGPGDAVLKDGLEGGMLVGFAVVPKGYAGDPGFRMF